MTDVYERIMRAAKRGTGMKLSAEDVWLLSMDTAIIDAAGYAENRREDERADREAAERSALVVQPTVRKKR